MTSTAYRTMLTIHAYISMFREILIDLLRELTTKGIMKGTWHCAGESCSIHHEERERKQEVTSTVLFPKNIGTFL